ncbi:MAG: ATP-binding protein [Armatimonadota bacterium]|nr:ATP-binding protein [bacterium]
METKSLEFKIPADTRYVSIVRHGVRSLAESVGFVGEEITDMEVAVSEAVTNSVTHGSPNADMAVVVVRCHASGECLVVEVEDESRAESIPTPSIMADLRDEHGRGLEIMRTLVDVLEDSRTEHGMKVRMAKQKAAR